MYIMPVEMPLMPIDGIKTVIDTSVNSLKSTHQQSARKRWNLLPRFNHIDSYNIPQYNLLVNERLITRLVNLPVNILYCFTNLRQIYRPTI